MSKLLPDEITGKHFDNCKINIIIKTMTCVWNKDFFFFVISVSILGQNILVTRHFFKKL